MVEAPEGKGYYQTTLTIRVEGACGGMTTVALHRIVAYTFLGPPPSPSYTVDHVDRKRENNCVDNLAWVDARDQLANRETSSYVLVGDGGATFKTLKSLSQYANVSTRTLSCLLRHSTPGDSFTVNGRHFRVQHVRRQLMAAPNVCSDARVPKCECRNKRYNEVLLRFVDDGEMSVSRIAENMGIAESTVLSYLGKAARESEKSVLEALALRLGLEDVLVRRRIQEEVASLSAAAGPPECFDASYRRVISQYTKSDWRVVRQTFRSICQVCDLR